MLTPPHVPPPAPGAAGATATIGAVSTPERPHNGPLQVSTAADSRAVVIRLVGELDLAGAPALTSAVQWAVAEGGEQPLVLDMREVSFIDSTGVRTLLEAANAAGRTLALMAPSSPVTRVLELTRLRGRFLEVDDLDSPALARG